MSEPIPQTPLEPPKRKSAFKPLVYPVFRYLWIATMVSNIGTWMQNVSAAWVMTSLTTSSIMVALLQAATSLPVVFFSVPAGAMADIFNRRKLMMVIQIFLVAVAGLGTTLYFMGMMTPFLLLLLTFTIGTGTAFNAPAWFSTTPEIVPHEDLSEAITLNGISVNSARAIGPALAGIVISVYSPGFAFAMNAISFVGLIFALMQWNYKPSRSTTFPSERFFGSMKAGIRYVRQSSQMHNIFLHAGGFFIFSSALWALMPLIARNELHLHATGYGVLLTSMGLGSISSAFILPFVRDKLNRNQLVFAGGIIYALGLLLLGSVPNIIFANLALFATGVAWITTVSSLHHTAQTSTASWVRARALSVYLAILSGGMGVGSIIWGNVAEIFNVPDTLLIAGCGLIIICLALYHIKLPLIENADFEPSPMLSEAIKSFGNEDDEKGVMISIEYIIADADREAFLSAVTRLEAIRRRDGAVFWAVVQGVEEKDKYTEYFIADSWLEHLRQHERITKADRRIQEAVSKFHKGDKPPKISHKIIQLS